MIKKLLIIFQIILLAMVSFAQQTFTIAEINYMLSPNNSYVQKDTTSNAQFFSGFVTAPIVINEKSTFLSSYNMKRPYFPIMNTIA